MNINNLKANEVQDLDIEDDSLRRIQSHKENKESARILSIAQKHVKDAALLEEEKAYIQTASVESSDQIQKELESISKKIPKKELQACHPQLVLVNLQKTKYKRISIHLRFPDNYPQSPLLIELKSKTLPEKLLKKLTLVCEKECQANLGKAQILALVDVVRLFVNTNMLITCWEEILMIKSKYLGPKDVLKMNEKTGVIKIKLNEGKYNYSMEITIPDEYPVEPPEFKMTASNFPYNYQRIFLAQTEEQARMVHRNYSPKARKNAPPPEPAPCLGAAVFFLSRDLVHCYPRAACQLCHEQLFPEDPAKGMQGVEKAKRVERVYCGHLYHFGCLDKYMTTPPFGKACPGCNQRIYHPKWTPDIDLLEKRWATQQARIREVMDVTEFLQLDKAHIKEINYDELKQTGTQLR
eukprot:GCRY01004575.1.p1 GENE.GCRY01004575.1~~GCRY01004575.1.p1  ORF type:complete len:434 (-),score=98.96 GCRY01004575.1:338-1567(-)